MSFKSVWGFDPDEVIRAQKLGWRKPNVDDSAYASEEQRPPHMPLDVSAQIYELRRMFRLDSRGCVWNADGEEVNERDEDEREF